jgi:hypothetical protein
MHGIRNQYLSAWVDASGLSHGEIVRRVSAEAIRCGHRQVRPDASRLRRWIEGENPRPPVPQLLGRVLSDAVGVPLHTRDLGFASPVECVDTVKLPLLSTRSDLDDMTAQATSLAAARAAVALALAVIGYHHAVINGTGELESDAQRLLQSALDKAQQFAEQLGGVVAPRRRESRVGCSGWPLGGFAMPLTSL